MNSTSRLDRLTRFARAGLLAGSIAAAGPASRWAVSAAPTGARVGSDPIREAAVAATAGRDDVRLIG
jgi:hypothetical protein